MTVSNNVGRELSPSPLFQRTFSSGSSASQVFRASNLFSEKVWRAGSQAFHYDDNGNLLRVGSNWVFRDSVNGYITHIGNDQVFYDETNRRAIRIGEKEITYSAAVLTHIGADSVFLEEGL